MADQRTTPRRDHVAVAREAGLGRVSLLSVLAGTLTSYGTFAVVAAIVGAVLAAAEVDTDFSTNDWASTGAAGMAATAVALLVAYLFGGYVAGRMARRSGVLHGVAVVVLGLLAAAVAGALVTGLADADDVERNLRSIGVPTTADDWGDVGLAGAIAALVAMVVGGTIGGGMGERWHTKLARRAADPTYGPAADARRRADAADAARDRELLARDDLVGRDATLAAGDRRRDDTSGTTTAGPTAAGTTTAGARSTDDDRQVDLRDTSTSATDDTTTLERDTDRERARQASLDDADRSSRRS